jgi:hypothetical protein
MFRVCETGRDLIAWKLVVESTVQQKLQVNEESGRSRLKDIGYVRG